MQGGKINFSQAHRFLTISNLKTQSERHAIKWLLKVQISQDHPTSNTYLSDILRPCLFLRTLRFPIIKCLPFFFSNKWKLLSDYQTNR